VTQSMHDLLLVTKARRMAAHYPDYGHSPVVIDGRTAWPAVVWYAVGADEALCVLPPRQHDIRFKVVVLDLKAYDRLATTGMLYDDNHTGFARRPWIDNRKAPGG
jgi:hypothetical protein